MFFCGLVSFFGKNIDYAYRKKVTVNGDTFADMLRTAISADHTGKLGFYISCAPGTRKMGVHSIGLGVMSRSEDDNSDLANALISAMKDSPDMKNICLNAVCNFLALHEPVYFSQFIENVARACDENNIDYPKF